MCNALGIITYNDSSVYVEGMQKYRPIAGFSFLGRYRLVDFAISNMSNSGIDDIQIYVNGNPRSLIDHVGTGRHYNINSKHGHLSLVPIVADGVKIDDGAVVGSPDSDEIKLISKRVKKGE